MGGKSERDTNTGIETHFFGFFNFCESRPVLFQVVEKFRNGFEHEFVESVEKFPHEDSQNTPSFLFWQKAILDLVNKGEGGKEGERERERRRGGRGEVEREREREERWRRGEGRGGREG
jgi:hypothetical protein